MKCYLEDGGGEMTVRLWGCSHSDAVAFTITLTHSANLNLTLTLTASSSSPTTILKIACHVVFCYFRLFRTIFRGFKSIHWIELYEIYRLICVSALDSASGRTLSGFTTFGLIFDILLQVFWKFYGDIKIFSEQKGVH